MFSFFMRNSMVGAISKDIVSYYLLVRYQNDEFSETQLTQQVWERYIRNHGKAILMEDGIEKSERLLIAKSEVEKYINMGELNLYYLFKQIIYIEVDVNLDNSRFLYKKMIKYFIKYCLKFDLDYMDFYFSEKL